jgi:hypothetical protein
MKYLRYLDVQKNFVRPSHSNANIWRGCDIASFLPSPAKPDNSKPPSTKLNQGQYFSEIGVVNSCQGGRTRDSAPDKGTTSRVRTDRWAWNTCDLVQRVDEDRRSEVVKDVESCC